MGEGNVLCRRSYATTRAACIIVAPLSSSSGMHKRKVLQGSFEREGKCLKPSTERRKLSL
jgi:hypothetical protein